ncbi:MAG: hypothetical protein ABFC38_13200 [Methanospirillum sp.]
MPHRRPVRVPLLLHLRPDADGRGALSETEAGPARRYLDFVVVVGGRDEYIVEDRSAPATAP